ncbi:MAG TPA: sigma 54-interacting transcriptional regulator [Bacteroidia bacterium]|nr:sigma 54-interacting transcriptional regulator [Bacteroidia bacterium]
MKILVSWLAFQHDFKDGEAIESGPTCSFHSNFFEHDKHYILSSAKEDDLRALKLFTLLSKKFKGREFEIVYLGVDDVINVNEIRQKVERWMLSIKDDEIDIFVSPGTPQMQIAWYFIHLGGNYKTRLLQSREAKFTKSKERPELVEINFEQSQIPTAVTILDNELSKSGKPKQDSDYIITDSIQPVYDQALKIAHTDDITTLILGMSGVGKEHLANYVHEQSTRKGKPFIVFNCAGIGDQLLESRLFGYKKGAFTGAGKDAPGLFHEADKGSIFLDEIGDISPYMQQALLRVIQQKEIHPVGGKPEKVDVRIICATNQNLIKRCEEDKFRWDLYYRLAVGELHIPALLERGKAELKNMIEFFNKLYKKKLKRTKLLEFDKQSMEVMLNYHFPGNLRELENLIAKLHIFCDGLVQVKDLPERMIVSPIENPLRIEHVEAEHIKRVLKLKNGNKEQTRLAIGYGSVNTLVKKMKDANIDPDMFS